jgi:hypothetical protein
VPPIRQGCNCYIIKQREDLRFCLREQFSDGWRPVRFAFVGGPASGCPHHITRRDERSVASERVAAATTAFSGDYALPSQLVEQPFKVARM